MIGQLYVVHIGNVIKVGKTRDLAQRLATYRRDADRYGLDCALLHESPVHLEVDENEIAVLARFRPIGQHHEYLNDVDPAEVIAFIKELPCTPPLEVAMAANWIPRAQAADRLDIRPATLDRWIATGLIRSRKNPLTRRVSVASEDVDAAMANETVA